MYQSQVEWRGLVPEWLVCYLVEWFSGLVAELGLLPLLILCQQVLAHCRCLKGMQLSMQYLNVVFNEIGDLQAYLDQELWSQMFLDFADFEECLSFLHGSVFLQRTLQRKGRHLFSSFL